MDRKNREQVLQQKLPTFLRAGLDKNSTDGQTLPCVLKVESVKDKL